jgi:hypothetical protein
MLVTLSLISNTSALGIEALQFQLDVMRCPFPLVEGQDQLILNGELAFGMNVTHTLTNGTDYGTKYSCELDVTSPTFATTFYADYKNYRETCFNVIPCGQFTFIGDTINNGMNKFGAFMNILTLFLTPINFNILGFGINDIGGTGLAIVIAVYAFIYIGIGAFIAVYGVGLVSRLL